MWQESTWHLCKLHRIPQLCNFCFHVIDLFGPVLLHHLAPPLCLLYCCLRKSAKVAYSVPPRVMNGSVLLP
jgi:hypothetical protein